jgi:hypothetical protein
MTLIVELFSNVTMCAVKCGPYDHFYPHFYLQTVQMQVHLTNGVMGGEAWRGAPISTLCN